MTAAWSSPARPASAPAADAPRLALNGGPSQRVALRRSAALYLATALFVVVAVAAVWATIAPRFGMVRAALTGAAVFAILALAAVRHARNEPRAFKIGPDGMSVWSSIGILRAQGRIVGCSQWSDCLLMLSLEDEGGRSHRLLIAADMLERDLFRELAVLARRSAHV
ncbi:protein YgfX [Paraburkholderia phymatum]|uniref:protein YgfX n=1 Tax=Paraburkholderia phymatum TaxID=148447 RepID=UPI00316D9229